MPRDSATILDLLAAADAIAAFTAGLDRVAFLEDAKTQAAVLYELAVLGEAAKRLSPAFRARHSGIPWKQIAGMRDHLIHGYDSVDQDDVWDATRGDVPALRLYLETVDRGEEG
jgi:uncharacterized protein with HEPN domain